MKKKIKIPRRHETAVFSVFRPYTSRAVADGKKDLWIEATAIDGKNWTVMSLESQSHFLGRRSRFSRTTDHDTIFQTEHELRAYARFVVGRRDSDRLVHFRLVRRLKIEHENFDRCTQLPGVPPHGTTVRRTREKFCIILRDYPLHHCRAIP